MESSFACHLIIDSSFVRESHSISHKVLTLRALALLQKYSIKCVVDIPLYFLVFKE